MQRTVLVTRILLRELWFCVRTQVHVHVGYENANKYKLPVHVRLLNLINLPRHVESVRAYTHHRVLIYYNGIIPFTRSYAMEY